MKRHGALTLAFLLSLLACKKQAQAPTPELATKDSAPTYELQIVFHGLIAFAQDASGVWAFLVKARYDPLSPLESSLPPGVLREAQADPDPPGFLRTLYPQHFAQIRFDNAAVTGVPAGGSIDGGDLRFITNIKTLSPPSLLDLAHVKTLVKARRNLAGQEAQIAPFDTLDKVLVGAPPLDGRLAARALIEAGDVVARPVIDCGATSPNTYSFKAKAEGLGGCPGDPADAFPLAEEVVVTLRVTGQTLIKLGALGTITVDPVDPTKTVTIEVANQVNHAPCAQRFHEEAFRWYYSLLPALQRRDLSRQYFACQVDHSHGGTKCPEKLFTSFGS